MGSRLSSTERVRVKSGKTEKRDQFLVNYLHTAHETDFSELDQRRLVFVSLLGLFQTWKKCPPYQLYSALLIMPLKSKWIYHPRKHRQALQTSLIGQLTTFGDKEGVAEFMELLKWKDSQQLVIWCLDEESFSTDQSTQIDAGEHALSDPLIAPFWRYVSKALTSLVDPITTKSYQPLKDTKWWRTSYSTQATKLHDDMQVAEIMGELYFVPLKFKTMCELIYQSNPGALRPVVRYSAADVYVAATKKHRKTSSTPSMHMTKTNLSDEEDEEVMEEDGWWISPEYDPYDLDQATSTDHESEPETC